MFKLFRVRDSVEPEPVAVVPSGMDVKLSDKTSGPTIWFLVVAGSASTTLALVAKRILHDHPHARIVAIDSEAFNTQTRSKVVWDAPGEVLRLAPEDLGLINFSKRRALPGRVNLLLNGGQFAFDRLVRRIEKDLAHVRPDLVVTCNDTFYAQRAFLSAARKMGADTVLVQEGPFTIVRSKEAGPRPGLIPKMALAARKLGLIPPTMPYGAYGHSMVLATSQDYAGRFVAAGVAPHTIRFIGVPRFDPLLQIARSRSDPPRVIYVFQPFVAQGRVVGSAARATLAEMAKGFAIAYERMPFTLVTRPHPRSDHETFGHFEGCLTIPYSRSAGGPLDEEVAGASCSVGHYSIGLLESLMMGVPVVSMPIPIEAFTERLEGEKQLWFDEAGVPYARTADEFAELLIDALTHGVPSTTDVTAETGPMDGKATDRAAEAIAKLLKDRSDG